jgi:hypothetical protein
MTIHAPPVQPTAAPHHVDRWLAALLAVVLVAVIAVVWSIGGYDLDVLTPTSDTGAAEYMIDLRASERAGRYPAASEWQIMHRALERASSAESVADWMILHRASERSLQ